MILHQELPELCIDGGMDEGASIEELSEQILYYHDASRERNPVTVPAQGHESHATSEAVQFAGLCSALLSLPGTLAGNGLSDEETKEVHLEKATLVFIPLEAEHHKIVAVAQVQRSNPASSEESDTKGSGSPLAIRTSVRKCHEFFCLLRGGIHETLSAPPRTASENDQHKNDEARVLAATNGEKQSPTYPGMDQLYSLRKQARRLKWETSRTRDLTSQEEDATLIASLEEKIRCLAESLPIHALRMQLRTHYDEYIADASFLAATTGVLHRSLVENVPVPITMQTATLVRDSPMTSPSPVAVLALGKVVQSLLDNAERNRVSHEPQLVGISSFFKGHLIFSHKCPDERDCRPQQRLSIVSPQTACLLMEFMASYRRKIALHSLHHSGLQKMKPPSSPRRMNSAFRRFLSGSFVDEDTIIDADDDSANERNPGRGRFLSPPPLSMLNVSDKVLQVNVPSHGTVWTPLISLPRECPRGTSTSIATNLALYDVGEYSFLLYLRRGESIVVEDEHGTLQWIALTLDASDCGPTNSPTEGMAMASSAIITDQVYSRLLQMIAVELANAVNGSHDFDGAAMEMRVEDAEDGQYVVFVDRIAQKLVLLSGENVQKEVQSLVDKNTSGVKLLGNSTQYDLTSSEALSGIDCRHLLASRLPPNVVSAFDDMMNDVDSQRLSGKEKAALQLCTYMPQGWAYAHAHNDQELYVFFNASKFVTVSDVQHAADRLRTKLFNKCNR
jgi:hypothetical protein